ncbi:nucleotide exchange factor GrpE [Hujiaoplasma nucleasis]|uniref:Protein GrpE n=1 Tax=Hujiaoplasma nucleasis TaxID=2725268 RepID=A0A7L6N2U8_9MOLU|nr:nucleotide exchange factor GrpE [Hujiaoplasma nucleasis]QLY39557.1 nucleotide exchange factor GrpE [Hujiaoplasma nucleasis]
MSEKDLEKELFDEKNIESNNEVNDEIENEESKLKKKKHKKNKLELQLDEIQEELETLKDKYYRNLAEMENYKKRTTNELVKERKYASQSMADKLIDSVEVFTQALNIKTDDKQMQNFLYGFKMIRDMIFNALKDEGVSEIETKIGDTFDPNIHEAMDTIYDPDKEEHTIVKVSKTGYKFKDRVLRPAFVVINVKANEEENENQDENQKIDEINNEGKDE